MNACESCGMSLNDKTISQKDTRYCIYCQDQETGVLRTYEQVKEGSINAAIKFMGKSKEEAEKMAEALMPKLPRWKKQTD